MNREEITKKILELCAEVYEVPVESIGPSTVFDDELSPSSLLRVSLSANIEEELDIMMPLSEVSKLKTIGQLIDFAAEA